LVHIALIFTANLLTKGVGQIGLRARAFGHSFCYHATPHIGELSRDLW
jgi:hypothetical protein